MITLYSGIPGSGKTYKMVKDLVSLKDKYFVVHNIDGFSPEFLGEYGVDFRQYCEKQGLEVTDFFSKEYQIKFVSAVKEKYDRNVLVVIDEAHEWFDRHSKKLKMWLSYHRHLMQEIWLVAHRSSNLPSVYRSFIEIEYRAKSGSMVNIPGRFLYNRIVGGQRVGWKMEKKDAAVFELYKSQMQEQPVKQKKSLLIPGIALFACLAFLGFISLPKMLGYGKAAEAKEVKKEPGKKVNDNAETVARRGGDPSSPVARSKGDVAERRIEDRYAFVGGSETFIVLEDRASGAQIRADQLPGRYVVIEVARGQYARLFSLVENRELTFVGGNRAQRFAEGTGANRSASYLVGIK